MADNQRTAITFWVSSRLKYWPPALIKGKNFVSGLCGKELEGDKTIQESPQKILQSFLCTGTVWLYLQLLLIDGFCSKYPALGRMQPPQAICCSVPVAVCESQVRMSDVHYPIPRDWLPSSLLQLTLWHSSSLLSSLLDLKVSCSVIYLLLRNDSSSDSLILPSLSLGQQGWILVESLVWEKFCLCSQVLKHIADLPGSY